MSYIELHGATVSYSELHGATQCLHGATAEEQDYNPISSSLKSNHSGAFLSSQSFY